MQWGDAGQKRARLVKKACGLEYCVWLVCWLVFSWLSIETVSLHSPVSRLSAKSVIGMRYYGWTNVGQKHKCTKAIKLTTVSNKTKWQMQCNAGDHFFLVYYSLFAHSEHMRLQEKHYISTTLFCFAASNTSPAGCTRCGVPRVYFVPRMLDVGQCSPSVGLQRGQSNTRSTR